MLSSFPPSKVWTVSSPHDPAEQWPSPVASSTLSVMLLPPLQSRVSGGEGIVFPFLLHALLATSLLTRVGPCVFFRVWQQDITGSARWLLGNSLTGEHWGSLLRSSDRWRKHFIDSFFFCHALVHVVSLEWKWNYWQQMPWYRHVADCLTSFPLQG